MRPPRSLKANVRNIRSVGIWNDSLFGRFLAFFALAITTTASLLAARPLIVGYERFASDDAQQAGRLLLSELSCTACHATDQASLKPKPGPRLDGVGRRLRRQWVHQFLTSPSATKPGTTMPDLFKSWSASEREEAVTALTAFLMTQQKPLPELKSTASNPIASRFWAKGDADRGKTLYHQIGCVACHQPADDQPTRSQPSSTLDPETLADLGITPEQPIESVPHPSLTEKYSAHSLTHFLLDPLATRSGGRMPNLNMSPQEAADLAAYLLPATAVEMIPDPGPPQTELVSIGRRLFGELGCASCHTAIGIKSKRPAPLLSELGSDTETSCLRTAGKGLPSFNLDDSQRAAIENAIAHPTVDNDVDHRMRQLNCYACHERADRGGVGPQRRQFFETVGHVDLGDEGRIPPPLDGVGRKLTRNWFQRVFAGTGSVRPHLHTRMPSFGEAADSLVDSFAAEDLTDSAPDPFGDLVSTAEAGRALLDVGCVQCHPLRGEHLPGVLGTDLAEIDLRVRPQWFRKFILDPGGVKKRTRMPTFFRNGMSPNPELLGGDVDRQVASLWKYLSEIKQHPLPEKIQQGRAHNFELVPKERPILLRTFMTRAGPHAIAVGFPDQVHLAFDAENVRVAQFWRGRFLDAHGTWFDRFTPPAKPLGSDLIELNVPSGQVERQFKGYRLDRQGIPTFLYRVGTVDVEDRLTPTAELGMARHLSLSVASGGPDAAGVWVPVIAGKKLTRRQDGVVENEDGLAVTLLSGLAAEAQVKTDDGVSSWLIPATVDETTEIKLEYRW